MEKYTIIIEGLFLLMVGLAITQFATNRFPKPFVAPVLNSDPLLFAFFAQYRYNVLQLYPF